MWVMAWQNGIDTTLANKLFFKIDPVAGLLTPDSKQPGFYTLMADELVGVKVEVTTDGTKWVERSVTDLGGDNYSAVINVPGDQSKSGLLYSFRISARDQANNTLVYQFQMPTALGRKDLERPKVSVVAPLSGESIGGTYEITVNATDDVGISKIELYFGNDLVDTRSNTPYVFDLDTKSLKDGSYTLVAKAYDTAGNFTNSGSVNISIDNTPPKISMISPLDGSVVLGALVNLSAEVKDDSKIEKVEFYLQSDQGDVILGTDSQESFIFYWDSTKLSDGKYSIYAGASDRAGNLASSPVITVEIRNQIKTGPIPIKEKKKLDTL